MFFCCCFPSFFNAFEIFPSFFLYFSWFLHFFHVFSMFFPWFSRGFPRARAKPRKAKAPPVPPRSLDAPIAVAIPPAGPSEAQRAVNL